MGVLRAISNKLWFPNRMCFEVNPLCRGIYLIFSAPPGIQVMFLNPIPVITTIYIYIYLTNWKKLRRVPTPWRVLLYELKMLCLYLPVCIKDAMSVSSCTCERCYVCIFLYVLKMLCLFLSVCIKDALSVSSYMY